MKKHILIILTIFLCYQLSAQVTKTMTHRSVQKGIKMLKVGDMVPDFKIAKIFNGTKKSAMISDFKDRLLIFDFGNTHCGGCIAALPRMDSLEQKFGDKLRIFWVTYEPEAVLQKFWKTSKLTKGNKLQTVVEDSTVKAYFRHENWPHEAWIYKGKVIAITGPDYVDSNNIAKVLNGSAINWPVKNDYYVFDGTKRSLFAIDGKQVDTSNTFIKYSAISDYKEGVNSTGFSGGAGIVRDSEKKTIRTFFLNQPIFNSYFLSWLQLLNNKSLVKPGFMLPNEVVWEVVDRSKYIHRPEFGYEQEWIRKHGICYESFNSDTGQTDQQVHLSIIKDMDRLLGLKVRWEKRMENVYVLEQTASVEKYRSKSRITDPEKKHVNQKGSKVELRDIPLNTISWLLNQQANNPYVFDKTTYKDCVDLDLNIASWSDISAVRKALQPFGLDLKEEQRLVDKLVFTEVDGGKLVDAEMQAGANAKREAQKDMADPKPEDNKAFLETNKSKPGVVTLPSGLQYKIIKQGTGARPTVDSRVILHYQGTLVNGKIFDSSYEWGRAMAFQVNEVIKGWTEALQLMSVGSKWILYIPAELAYGDHTNSGSLPRNSALIFEVELCRIVQK